MDINQFQDIQEKNKILLLFTLTFFIKIKKIGSDPALNLGPFTLQPSAVPLRHDASFGSYRIHALKACQRDYSTLEEIPVRTHGRTHA